MQPTITYTVEPVDGGARFTRAVELRPTGIKVLMAPVMAFLVPRRNTVFVANLKRARVPPRHVRSAGAPVEKGA